MPTKPAIDGDIARQLYAALGEEAADVLDALADMNDAKLARRNAAYWRAATKAGRYTAIIADVLNKLSRGEYQEARRKLGLLPED